MMLRVAKFSALVATAIVALANQALPDDDPMRAQWRPMRQDSVAAALDAADALIERALPAFAARELDEIALEIDDAPYDVRARFAALAIRAQLERVDFARPESRRAAREKIDSLRALVERDGEALNDAAPHNANAANCALADLRARTLLAEFEDDPDARRALLDDAEARAEALARNLPKERAKIFLYWLAAAKALDAPDDVDRLASALAKSCRSAKDALFFAANVQLIQSARRAKDFDRARKLVQESLDALQSVADRPNAPKEAAVALLAEEIQLLLDEGKTQDALRQAATDQDLLGAPLPENLRRDLDALPDPFDALELAKLRAFWSAIESADDDVKDSILDEARRARANLASADARARARAFEKDLGDAIADPDALVAVAEEAYRRGEWRAAVDAYDRAAQCADDSAKQTAVRAARAAAAILEKACGEFDKNGKMSEEEIELRRDAAKRFERVANDDPDQNVARDFLALAAQYRDAVGDEEDALRLRMLFLTNYPEDPDRAECARALAERVAKTDRALARRALDFIRVDDPEFARALELESALARDEFQKATSDRARKQAFARVAKRLLARVANDRKDENGENGENDDLDAVADAIGRAKLEPATPAILGAILALASACGATSDAAFADRVAAALQSLADAAREKNASARAPFDSLRLAFALDAKRSGDVADAIDSLRQNAQTLDLETLETLLDFAQNLTDDARRRAAEFVLKTLDSSDRNATDDPIRLELARAEAARLAGRAQDALDRFAKIVKSRPKEKRAIKGLARTLEAQTRRPEALRRAIAFWTDLAELEKDASKEWWDAKERCVMLYCQLGNVRQAEKMTQTLWLTRSDPTDRDRETRWKQAVAAAKRAARGA